MRILENNKKFYKNSEDVGMAQKAQKQGRNVTISLHLAAWALELGQMKLHSHYHNYYTKVKGGNLQLLSDIGIW